MSGRLRKQPLSKCVFFNSRVQRISLVVGPLATYTGSAGVSRMRSLLVQARSLSLKLESFGTPSVFASLPKLRVVVGDVNSSVQQQQQQRNRPTPMPVHFRPFRVSKRKEKKKLPSYSEPSAHSVHRTGYQDHQFLPASLARHAQEEGK